MVPSDQPPTLQTSLRPEAAIPPLRHQDEAPGTEGLLCRLHFTPSKCQKLLSLATAQMSSFAIAAR